MFLKWFLGSLWLVPWVAVVKELWRWHINWVFQSMLLPFEEFFRVKILVDPFWAERFLWEYIFRVGLTLWVLWRGAIFFGRYMERLLSLLKIVNERVRFGSWDMAVSPCIKYVVEYLPWGWNSPCKTFIQFSDLLIRIFCQKLCNQFGVILGNSFKSVDYFVQFMLPVTKLKPKC